jgi:hypothetical protein
VARVRHSPHQVHTDCDQELFLTTDGRGKNRNKCRQGKEEMDQRDALFARA